ncbi:hypothetical protein DdX_06653 [Ditylenchus destructor]|uniref:Uncharacterized protein n=1 Tax=Ditylenchus destructor TaxID=166010 RepID=A0AAD4R5X4_9BILA|nr:hypothetical protein DdX_06653 [Ditylenchus destructor]
MADASAIPPNEDNKNFRAFDKNEENLMDDTLSDSSLLDGDDDDVMESFLSTQKSEKSATSSQTSNILRQLHFHEDHSKPEANEDYDSDKDSLWGDEIDSMENSERDIKHGYGSESSSEASIENWIAEEPKRSISNH